MRARVKATGKIIEVSWRRNIITSCGVEKQYVDNNCEWCTYVQSELEFIKEEPQKDIDWEQRRYEIVPMCSQNLNLLKKNLKRILTGNSGGTR